MKISAKTRKAIIRFLTNPRLVEKSNIDYSASLIYNIDCFPRLLYLSANRIENGIRAVSLNIVRNGVCSAANPCEALLKSCGSQISRFSIQNKIYYIGCGCIFNNEFEPILLTYMTADTLFDTLFARFERNDVSVIFINNAYVNNDNIFNNFLSKKIIPVLFEKTMEIRLLDPLRINRLVIKPNNIELTKEAYWNLIINKQ